MTIARINDFKNGGQTFNQQNTSSATITAGNTVSAGELLVVAVMKQNVVTVEGNSNELAISDEYGNGYNKIYEYTNTAGVAKDGATCALWWCIPTVAIAMSHNITLTYTNNGGTSCYGFIYGYRYSVAALKRASLETYVSVPVDGSTVGAVTISGLPTREHLFFRAAAIKGSETPVATASWTERANTIVSSSITCYVEDRIQTTDTATSQPTGISTNKWAESLMAAFNEYTPQAQLFAGTTF